MTVFDAITVGRRVLAAEAEALGQLAAGLDDTFTAAVETLFAAKGRIVLTGIGKSGHVARKIAATWSLTVPSVRSSVRAIILLGLPLSNRRSTSV